VNANDQVFPIQGYQNPNGFEGPSGGTDLRAYIATAALQGLLASPDYNSTPEGYARDAVAHANALIAELNRKEGV